MNAESRYTTREAAERLACQTKDAVPILRAAGVPSVRCGSAFLWDARAVDGLRDTIRASSTAHAEPKL